MTVDDLKRAGFIIIEHERPVILLGGNVYAAKTKFFKTENEAIEYFRNKHQRIIHVRNIITETKHLPFFIAIRHFTPHGTINEVWREYHNGISRQYYKGIYYGNDN